MKRYLISTDQGIKQVINAFCLTPVSDSVVDDASSENSFNNKVFSEFWTQYSGFLIDANDSKKGQLQKILTQNSTLNSALKVIERSGYFSDDEILVIHGITSDYYQSLSSDTACSSQNASTAGAKLSTSPMPKAESKNSSLDQAAFELKRGDKVELSLSKNDLGHSVRDTLSTIYGVDVDSLPDQITIKGTFLSTLDKQHRIRLDYDGETEILVPTFFPLMIKPKETD